MDSLISQDSILSNVKQMLRLSSADHDIWLNSLINQCLRDLSTVETLVVRNTTVTVTDNRFYFPKDLKKLLAFRSQDSCINGIFIDIPFFTQCGCSASQFTGLFPLFNIITVNGRWANLLNQVPDGSVIEIAYQRVNVDDDGMVVANEEAYTAASMYAAGWFANSYPEMYTPEQRRNWFTKYEYQANRCRGLAAARQWEQTKNQIGSKINQMINQPFPFSALAGSYSFLYPTITQIVP